jgi:uncharacterized protein YgiM (DUF1202 family)
MFLKTVTAARLILPVLLIASSAAAETRFIYPNLDLPVRRGSAAVYKIIKMVKVGEQVEQIEEKAGWAKIRMADGSEGWIEQRLLTADQPSGQRLEGLLTENKQLKQQIIQLEQNLGELNMGMTALKEHQGAEGDKVASCNAQLDAVRAEHRAEQDTTTAKRFVIALGVFVVGWLMGRISSGSRKRPARRLL